MALHFAARGDEPRLRGVAALCTPLDLLAAQRHVDRPACAFYRRWVLRGLQHVYAAVARRHAVPSPVADVWRCRTIHAWDTLAIAKRFGAASPEQFYARWSAARVLPALRVEAVLVLAQHDPVVPPQLALPWVGEAPAGRLRVCVLPRGGHLQFPSDASLGLDSTRDGAHDAVPAGDGVVSQLARHWRAST